MDGRAFNEATNGILRNLGPVPYRDSLAEIQQLEETARAGAHSQVAVSCAELRLDAALLCREPFEECETHYARLLLAGADPQTQLLKCLVFAREGRDAGRVLLHLDAALERAQSVTIPEDLIEQAEQVAAALRLSAGQP